MFRAFMYELRRWRKMSEIKLKPCPFCGGEAKFENMGEFVVTKCEDCGAESDMIRI